MAKTLNPANWKRPDESEYKQPMESYYINAANIAPSLFADLKRKLEDQMLAANVGISTRRIMKEALADETSGLCSDRRRTPEDKLFSFQPTTLRQGLRSIIGFQPFASGTDAQNPYVTLTCDSFERDRSEILALFCHYLNTRCEQAKAIGSGSAPKWRQAILLTQAPALDTPTYDRILVLADDATLELESDLLFGSENANTRQISQLEQTINARLHKKRKDAGSRHLKKRTSEWNKTQADVAYDFNQSRFLPEPGANVMGACPISKVKAWDRKYPDATHRNRYGYHAELRLKPEYKSDYEICLRRWKAHWTDYKRQFSEWRTGNPASKRSAFRYRERKLVLGGDMSLFEDR